MARLSRFAVATINATGIGTLLISGTYFLGLLPGGPLTRRYVVWSGFLLPVFLGIFAALWPSPKLKRGALLASSAGATIGFIYIYLATRVGFWVVFRNSGCCGRSVLFHPLDGDLDLEAFTFAVTTGACAMLLAMTSPRRKALLIAVILVIIAGIVPGSAFNLVTHNQEFIVAVVTPRNTDTPSRPEVFERIDMRHVDFDTMTSHILRSIGEAGITGQYQVVDLYRAGHGHRVLGIVVFSEPVATPIDLPEPRGTDVIYVQGHAGWKTIPSEVRPVNRHIQISPPYPEDNNNWLASMMIYDVTGVGTGFAVPNPTANRTHTHP